ncbi:MAG: iron-containing alcohol dehydrogenase [Verrucomicrobiota bacterium]|jgi:alcohol dehydrogenase
MNRRPAKLLDRLADSAVFAPFDHQPRTRIVFGNNMAERAGELARQIGVKKVLLVTDAGVVAAGHAERVRRSLQGARVQTVLFDKVRENPSTRDVGVCLSVARAAAIDGFVGLGGGSSLDTAKGCNFLLTNGGRMQDYRGVGKAARAMLPLIAIPTTAGTGSECQSFALIADETTHQKMACGDPKAAARIAILDPLLTLSQPPRVAACTGIDALSHALETAVTRPRNPISLAYSRQAFRLCWSHFPRMLKRPDDLEARAGMLLGAALAGLAIENSMLGAAHAAANPLSAHFNIVHGQAIGLMLPHVLRFNGRNPAAARLYASLDSSNADHLAEKLESLLDLAGLPRSLSQCGVTHSSIPVLAREAARQWTAAFNPRPVAAADFARLFEAAWENTK